MPAMKACVVFPAKGDFCIAQHDVRELERQLSDQAAAAQQELSHRQATAAADRSHAQVASENSICPSES